MKITIKRFIVFVNPPNRHPDRNKRKLRKMTFEELTNKICSLLPDGYQMIIELENGYGGVKMLTPDEDEEIDGHLDGSTLEEQVTELLAFAQYKNGNRPTEPTNERENEFTNATTAAVKAG